VRKLASELLGRLPIPLTLPILRDRLKSTLISETDVENEFTSTRSFIFVACHVFAAHGLSSSPILPAVLPVLFDVFTMIETQGKLKSL
jgi:hypothetical protein